jgi:formylglycine-generating enzyme required for sulfatase activity
MGSTELQREQALLACKAYGGENCPFVFDQPIKQTCFDSPYWISVTEITNQQFGSSSSTDMHTMYRGPQWPRETLTWQQANAFCESISARLPFEAEWEFAARGPDNLLYPWGNAMSAEYQAQSTRLNPYDVDELQIDTSWVGARGMAGNVAEWVMDVFKADSPQHVTRGGSWASYADFLLRTTQRIPYASDYKASILGFRCVMNENLE